MVDGYYKVCGTITGVLEKTGINVHEKEVFKYLTGDTKDECATFNYKPSTLDMNEVFGRIAKQYPFVNVKDISYYRADLCQPKHKTIKVPFVQSVGAAGAGMHILVERDCSYVECNPAKGIIPETNKKQTAKPEPVKSEPTKIDFGGMFSLGKIG